MLHCEQNREADQDWLIGRFDMLDEVLRNTPAYQRILKEGRDKGLEEGFEKGLGRGRAGLVRTHSTR
jgi:hypothetical protein